MKFKEIKLGDKLKATAGIYTGYNCGGIVSQKTTIEDKEGIHERVYVQSEPNGIEYGYDPENLELDESVLAEYLLKRMGEKVYFNLDRNLNFTKQFGRLIGINKRTIMQDNGCGPMKDFYKAVIEHGRGVIDIDFNDIKFDAEQERVRPRPNTNRSCLG